MKPTKLAIPDGYLLAQDNESFCILWRPESNMNLGVYLMLRGGFRDRYEALTWCYRWIAGQTVEQRKDKCP